MKPRTFKLTIIFLFVLSLSGGIILQSNASSDNENDNLISTGLGSVETLEAGYKDWAAKFEQNGGERNIVLPLSAGKLSEATSVGAAGAAQLNLVDKTVSVEVRGLPATAALDFWLVDNAPTAGGTFLPEAGDRLVRVGSLINKDGVAKLDAGFGADVPADFEPDFIAVTPAGKSPAEERLLTGQTTLFHRLYHSQQQGRFGVLSDQNEPAHPAAKKGVLARLFDFISPTAK